MPCAAQRSCETSESIRGTFLYARTDLLPRKAFSTDIELLYFGSGSFITSLDSSVKTGAVPLTSKNMAIKDKQRIGVKRILHIIPICFLLTLFNLFTLVSSQD
jgi:hypothetical protein